MLEGDREGRVKCKDKDCNQWSDSTHILRRGPANKRGNFSPKVASTCNKCPRRSKTQLTVGFSLIECKCIDHDGEEGKSCNANFRPVVRQTPPSGQS